jgi:hypothetical protein
MTAVAHFVTATAVSGSTIAVTECRRRCSMAAKGKSTPEDVIERLRAIAAEFEEIQPLSFEERRDLRNKMRMSDATLKASVGVVGSSDKIAQAIGRSKEDVIQVFSDRNRWTAVESEVRSLLNAVSSANLMRRHELELIAAQTYAIATQLARDPKNAFLVPFVQEMQRLRKLERRRKSRTNDEEPPAAE